MFTPNPLPRCTPESVGISSAQVERFLRALEHPLTGMNGVMAARHGRVFCEGWWAPFAPDLVHSNHSFGKSYTATAVGIAAGEGLLSLDETVTRAFAEEIAARGIQITDPRMERVTVRHLLTMSGGMARMSDISGDWIGHFFRSEMAYEPGEHFQYNSAGSCMLGALVEKRSGMGLKEYLTEKLFRKLGIDGDRYVWLKFQDGHTAEPGTFSTTEDNLRLAMLYCQGGRWNGEQLVPEWFIREALSVQIENPYAPEEKDGRCGYGYQLWACSVPGVYRFDGGQGQYGIIWPEKDLVVSIHEGAWVPKGPQMTLDAVYDHLFAHLSDEPLPEDDAAYRHLRDTEAALALPDDPANALPIHAELSGEYAVEGGDAAPWFAVAPPGAGNFFLEYQDRSIPAELSRAALTLDADACVCTLNGNVRIEAGWDGKLIRRFAEHTVFPQLGAYAATARFLSERELELHIHWINGWFETTLRFLWEDADHMHICSDQLRLTTGAEGLKGESPAVRIK